MINKLVYIAGPYRAKTINGIRENIRKAEEMAALVWKTGNFAVCPHKNTAFFDGLVDDEVFLEGAIRLMVKCDVVLLLDGYRESEGTMKELSLAAVENIPVYLGIIGLEKMLRD